MKNILITLLIAIFSIVLQTTIVANIFKSIFLTINLNWLSFMTIDLCFILVVYMGFNRDLLEGVILVAVIGYLMDLFSPAYIGLYSLVNILIFVLVKLTYDKFYTGFRGIIFLIVLVMTFIQGGIIILILSLSDIFNNFYLGFIKILPVQAVLNGLAAPIVFKFLAFVDKASGKEMKKEKIGLR